MYSTPSSRKPKKLLVDVETDQIQINWADDHESVYSLTLLRRACPCVECQPWKEGMGEIGKSPEAVLNATGHLKTISDVSPVGGYAIQFFWADGHSTGIYDWGYLRDLCPCDECTAKRSST